MNVSRRAVALVVGDEADVRRLLRRVLETNGYVVVEVDNSTDAIAIVERGESPDLLIADLDTPLVSGYEMASRIRMLRPELKVLYLSGSTDEPITASMLSKGDGFLDKPFSQHALLEAISFVQ